jgi:hypothetical protein
MGVFGGNMTDMTEIQVLVRCGDCGKWFNTPVASANDKCPACGGDLDQLATSRLLDLAVGDDDDDDMTNIDMIDEIDNCVNDLRSFPYPEDI